MSAEAKKFLDRWHAYIDTLDPALLDGLLAENAGISSPAYFKPKQSKAYVAAILTAVNKGFEDFHYTKEWIDGREMILEFEARIGDTQLKGIDRMTIDAEGRLAHIEVLIRPLNGLMALADHVKASLATDAA